MPGVPLSYPDPPLAAGAIRLRKWAGADLDCVREAGTDPEIPKVTTVPSRFTEDEGLAFVRRQWSRAEDGVGVSQAIVEAETDRALGLVIISLRPQPGVGGLGYWLTPSARGRGAACAAVRLVTPWAFESLGLQRLEAWVDPGNTASQRVLTAAGYELEGRLRNFFRTAGHPADALVFSAVPRDPVGIAAYPN